MNICIPDFIKLGPEVIEQIKSLGNLTIYDDANNDEDVIISRIKDADIITANYINITSKVIRNSPKLKYVVVPAVAADWVDIVTCREVGIKVLNCPTYNSQAVAEHAIGLMFAVKRQIVNAHNMILNGEWKPKSLMGTELKGKRLTVYGYGNIGKRVYDLASGLGMDVSYINSKTSKEEVNKLIGESDVIVLYLPLNDKTKGLFGKEKIQLMKPSAILINVARGLIVDNNYLINALENKEIAGAGLDVFPDDNTITKPTDLIMKYTKLNNVVLTPHLGYFTQESSIRLGEELVADIKSCIEGQPIHVIS